MTGTQSLPAASAVAPMLSSLSDLKQQFLALFPRRTDAIWKKAQNKRWFTNKRGDLADAEILAGIDGGQSYFIGCRFAPKTRFAVLDIDTGSPYYNQLSLIRLRRSLERVGIGRMCLYQSSNSGGWHLWIFFDNWVDSAATNKLLSSWLKHDGFALGSGILEVFPSANGLRLPLQRGFAWLSDNVLRSELSLQQALQRFLVDSQNGNDWTYAASEIARSLNAALSIAKPKKPAAGLITQRWQLGKYLWQNGLQERGQRNDAILAVEHYLWYGDREEGLQPLPGYATDQERQDLILEWLQEKHNGYCRHINRGSWRKIIQEISRACEWRTAADTYRPYAHTERKIERMMEDRSLTPERFITGNIARYNYALKRITQAYESLMAEGVTTITVNEVAIRAGAHWKTVRKHWDHLASSAGDQIPGSGVPVLVVCSAVPPVVPVAPVLPFFSLLAGLSCTNSSSPLCLDNTRQQLDLSARLSSNGFERLTDRASGLKVVSEQFAELETSRLFRGRSLSASWFIRTTAPSWLLGSIDNVVIFPQQELDGLKDLVGGSDKTRSKLFQAVRAFEFKWFCLSWFLFILYLCSNAPSVQKVFQLPSHSEAVDGTRLPVKTFVISLGKSPAVVVENPDR